MFLDFLFNDKINREELEDKRKQEQDFTEFDVCNYFIAELTKRGKDDNLFRIEQRTEKYTTLAYGNNGFLRVHISKIDDTKWISILMVGDNRKKYINSELFAAQENKNQVQWKAMINDFSDYSKFIDIAYESCFVYEDEAEPLTPEEAEIGNYLKKLFLECGAKEEDIKMIHKNEYAEIYYLSGLSKIEIKVYKKKNNCIRLYYYDLAKELKIKCDATGKIEFEKLEELDVIKPYIKDRVEKIEEDRVYIEKINKEVTGYRNLRNNSLE